MTVVAVPIEVTLIFRNPEFGPSKTSHRSLEEAVDCLTLYGNVLSDSDCEVYLAGCKTKPCPRCDIEEALRNGEEVLVKNNGDLVPFRTITAAPIRPQ